MLISIIIKVSSLLVIFRNSFRRYSFEIIFKYYSWGKSLIPLPLLRLPIQITEPDQSNKQQIDVPV